MKALVVILLIVNASLIVWQYDRHVAALTRESYDAAAAAAECAPRLKLLSEGEELPQPRNPAPAPVAEASSEIKADVDAADLCIDVGPFAQVAARARLRDFIDERSAAIHLRTVSVVKRQLFWVYLEPVPAGEAARSIADLERRGVKDFMLNPPRRPQERDLARVVQLAGCGQPAPRRTQRAGLPAGRGAALRNHRSLLACRPAHGRSR